MPVAGFGICEAASDMSAGSTLLPGGTAAATRTEPAAGGGGANPGSPAEDCEDSDGCEGITGSAEASRPKGDSKGGTSKEDGTS